MSEFLVKSKHFTTKHVWFDAEYEKIMGGGDTLKLLSTVPL